MTRGRIVYWREGIDAEDQLCVCQPCGAELNADCIGDECPVCGAPSDEAFPHPAQERDDGR